MNITEKYIERTEKLSQLSDSYNSIIRVFEKQTKKISRLETFLSKNMDDILEYNLEEDICQQIEQGNFNEENIRNLIDDKIEETRLEKERLEEEERLRRQRLEEEERLRRQRLEEEERKRKERNKKILKGVGIAVAVIVGIIFVYHTWKALLAIAIIIGIIMALKK